MKVLVTGGSGFIGSNFIRLMLEKHKDWSITNLDKLTYAGNPENLKDVETRYKGRYIFIKGDICDGKTVDDAMKDAELVFHFAAESHVDVSIIDPFIFTKSNVIGTHTMLESARKNNVKKFVHISTDEVYGSIREGSFSEESPFRPNSPYSASKAAADLMARAYFKTYGMPVIITRSSNNFGPFQYPEKVMPLFITNLIEGKKVPVYGTGMNVRDWIYVIDNCEGIGFAAEKGKIGEAYNVGGGNELPNIGMTRTIIKEMGKDDSSIEFVQDRLGHDLRYSLDCSKMNKLGWKPRHDFSSAIKETIDWYKKNEAWWKPLKDNLRKKGQIK
ncbi:dTDP-glucose 4,6-dehydratase [Candidatus Woesearchaeota archaeon CG10_big_fil_rev_8_21_14_0_10_44_13]|nr:MAG: dTDP-glucose 4,6-dehydratase [Candidatus Woesearchaeota archaeon CG10_big_fil_rev_8_21_14_0_10_44_13]